MEAGLGFGFLALVIGYLPVLYTAFSRREAQITMLDARAGSPPSAAEMLARTGRAGALDSLQRLDGRLGSDGRGNNGDAHILPGAAYTGHTVPTNRGLFRSPPCLTFARW